MKRILVVGFVASGLVLPAAALAQGRSDVPNMGHFYMARPQVDIIDEAPAVNDRRTVPGAAQQGGGGGLPARMPLPRAGWQPYSQTLPSFQQGLPKVINGVPPAMPAVQPKSGKAGAYKAPKVAAPTVPAGPAVAKTYAPYKRAADSAPATAASGGFNSSTNLQGRMLGGPAPSRASALHWSRTR